MNASSVSSACQERQDRVPCANIKKTDGISINCDQRANLECGKCHLVHYCSQRCQVAHWPQHKLDCNSDLRKANWRPTWDREGRKPSFVSDGALFDSFGHLRYLWGNVPAFDVLNLSKNEGVAHVRDLNLCFAASGDPRNLIESVINLPETYTGSCTCVINDLDQVVVCRNVVILLVAALLTPVEAADLMLHVWYSGRITSGMLQILKESVRDLIADVVGKIKSKGDDILLSKTWTFGPREISARLYKKQWSFLLKMLDSHHVVVETEKHRLHVMLNTSRLDRRERHLYSQTPAGRVCSHKMRETGVLVPFGSCLEQFRCSNPTLFDSETSEWLQLDSADPINSWSTEAVQGSAFHHGIPKEDLYGRLHFYIRDKLEQFCRKTASVTKIRFHLYCVNAAALPIHLNNGLDKMKFDRVEVANIVDEHFLGLELSLQACGSLLRPSAENPYATLITLFMNATHHAEEVLGDDYFKKSSPSIFEKAVKFAPPKSLQLDSISAAAVYTLQSRDMLRDLDHLFTYYMRMKGFDKISREAGMRMKAANTVVDEWPLRLRKEFGEPGAQEAFDRLMASGSRGDERYVEWVRSG